MAVWADGGISLSTAGSLRGSCRLGESKWRVVKFCNGELMGGKVKPKMAQLSANGGAAEIARQHVCMSLTADVASEGKVKSIQNMLSLILILIFG